MKTFIIAAMLLALASPAVARDYALTDCGNGIEVSEGKSMSVLITDPKNPHIEGSPHYPYPAKGKFTMKWNSRGLWLNGKKCTLLTPRVEAYRECVKSGNCDGLTGWEPHLTEAEKKAVKRSVQQH